jgi:pimeloyl-ACP methyl ester carboxylesterase
MKTIKFLALSVMILMGSISVFAQNDAKVKPTIIFVHGIWADGSCWNNQIVELQTKGYNVISVQNPITSLGDDVATTKRAIDRAEGDVILIGHSWGGFVITQAGNNPKVKALVYVAALAPDKDESFPSLFAKGPASILSNYFQPLDGFIYLSKAGIKESLAQDLSPKQQEMIYTTQIPASEHIFADKSGEPAWKTKTSWYIIANEDKALSPELQRFMAKRANAKTTTIEASHAVMISNPKEVLQVIEQAASFKK